MALLFNLDAERDARVDDDIDTAFGMIREHVAGLGPTAALRRIRRYQGQLSALETAIISDLNATTGNDRAAKRALNDGRTSRAKIEKAANRAKAAAENSDLIDKVADGDLSEEQFDVIADTAAKTGGAAATDAEFINKVAGVDPDQGRVSARTSLLTTPTQTAPNLNTTGNAKAVQRSTTTPKSTVSTSSNSKATASPPPTCGRQSKPEPTSSIWPTAAAI